MSLSEIMCLHSDDGLAGWYRVLPEVTYSTERGRDIPLTLIAPWAAADEVLDTIFAFLEREL